MLILVWICMHKIKIFNQIVALIKMMIKKFCLEKNIKKWEVLLKMFFKIN